VGRAAPPRPWPPRLCTLDPKARTRTRGAQAAEFVESYARIVKDSVAGRSGELMVLRPWQRKLLDGLLAEDRSGRLKHRAALIGMPRKNGKSAFGAGIALWSLFLGPNGGEVYSCAGTRDQARIVFGSARRIVEMDPELSANAKVYRDAIEIPATGSVYRVLSREAGASEGLSPTLTVFDEVHVQSDSELWDVMQLGAGARSEPLILGITTAGSRVDMHGRDSHCYKLYQYGAKVAAGEVEDPTFYFAWWEPRAGSQADHRDPRVWAEANPGYGDIVAAEDFASTVNRTSEPEFRTKRTNVWVTSSVAALPHGAWDRLAEPDRKPDPDAPVVLMADGSWSGDSTGIVAISVEARPHIWVVDLWEKDHDDPGWRVSIADVEATLRAKAKALPVVEVGMDPYRWQRSMQALENDGLPMAEFNMGSPERMVKAWKTFFDAVLDGGLSHSGDPRLARHVAAMVLKVDMKGARPTKDSKVSERHIDLGVCAVAGIDRALWHLENPPKRTQRSWGVLVV
jgi:phage terminase large subunit-like protein